VPADADAVLIAGPTQGFIDVEIQALQNYLRRGGGIILAVKPNAKHHLDTFLSQIGVNLKNDYVATVLDTPMGRAVDPRFTRGSDFSSTNQITKPFGKSEFVIFHLPEALEKTKPPEGITVDEIVKTNDSAMAFADANFKAGGVKGPFTLAVEVSGKYPGGYKPFQMLVFGDSDFMNDQYLYQNLNRDLVLNSVAALVKEENLISISPKEVQATKMELTDVGFVLFVFGFLIPLPILLFVASGVVWFRRRHA
jgi:ABC-type uncharacterized transport system involved in gliding motility auxiliary subunit